ncbi:MAG TPA: FliM/FliN family flagellar motor C-terminal domain-containing protein [Rhizomicrobium sp.]|nr:FliM/FliN family flagellar motor C-terminal domain-containing protein [Rhizomicrobium sp.]
MTQAARAWLPKSAFSLEAVGGCLTGPVTAWSDRWFARAPAAIAAVRVEEEALQAAAPHGVSVNGARAALDVSGRGKRRLLEAALDLDLAEQPLAETDRRLLDAFALSIVEDLAAALDGAFAAATPDGESGTRIVSTVTVGGSDVLTAAFKDVDLVPLIKKLAPARTALPSMPSRRSEALRKTKLDLHGHLGRAEIALADLEGLGIGDVLVLDRALAEPVELRVTQGGVLTRGRLCQNGDQFAIQL